MQLFFPSLLPQKNERFIHFFHSKSPYTKYEREQNAITREARNDDDDDDNTFEEDDDEEAKSDDA